MQRNGILSLTPKSIDCVNRTVALTDTKSTETRRVYTNDTALDTLRSLFPRRFDPHCLFPMGQNRSTMLFRRAVK
jgi:hypothetical protein